tara:strand:+ start:2941 stop:3360 length:420 start_codon:yes stop_codon:yes gene_type:complete
MSDADKIEVKTNINAGLDKVWEYWTAPKHIEKWNNASDDWITPKAENDLNKGGRFVYRMEAKDGSFGFDFGGTYTEVKTNEFLAYILDDDRKVTVKFEEKNDKIELTETFEPENQNPTQMQKDGWQAILDNFKKYTEEN